MWWWKQAVIDLAWAGETSAVATDAQEDGLKGIKGGGGKKEDPWIWNTSNRYKLSN